MQKPKRKELNLEKADQGRHRNQANPRLRHKERLTLRLGEEIASGLQIEEEAEDSAPDRRQ